MTNEQIEQLITSKAQTGIFDINFKKRNTIRGMFVSTGDFEHLKSKNLWRIITESKIEDWKKTKDTGLSRIYNGSDFTKIKAQ